MSFTKGGKGKGVLMHEMALVDGIMKIAIEQLEKNNLKRLTKIKLFVGEYSGAVPDALKFAFMATVAGSIHENAVMEIDEISGQAQCRFCGAEFSYEAGMACPECEGIAPKITKGDELLIDYLEAEEE